MIGPLLRVRFQSLFAGLNSQVKKKNKRSTGTVVLMAVLYIYVLAVVAGMMCLLFHSLAEPYHSLGLDWLYFAMSAAMGLTFSLLGSVFTTQSQLYDAKDNEFLLAMPIKPGAILLSRMIPLLSLNLLFASLVMIPATVIYVIFVSFDPVLLLWQLVALLSVTVLSQAIACLLGWLLHLLLHRLNKSVASLAFMITFLGLYFALYSKANELIQALAVNGEAIAGIMKTWVWPIYALGEGCLGNVGLLLAFLGIAGAAFALVYGILAITFLRTATASYHSRKRKKLDLSRTRSGSPTGGIIRKELAKFLGCPVYLTNMGLGLVMIAALPVAGLIFRHKILLVIKLMTMSLPGIRELIPVFIAAAVCFASSTCCISAPSVSLEGKNLWILRTMPIGSRQILEGKLLFHIVMAVPLACVAGLVLSIAFGCGLIACILVTLLSGLSALLTALLGMWAGLRWAKLDYISEAYPCKQSAAVAVSMFGMMGLPLVLGLGYWAVFHLISPTVFMTLCTFLLSLACWGLYRVIITWGVKKWETL